MVKKSVLVFDRPSMMSAAFGISTPAKYMMSLFWKNSPPVARGAEQDGDAVRDFLDEPRAPRRVLGLVEEERARRERRGGHGEDDEQCPAAPTAVGRFLSLQRKPMTDS